MYSKALFVLLLLATTTSTHAQKADSLSVHLNEVTIHSKGRQELLNLYLPYPKSELTSDDIRLLQPSNMADLIESSGSLSVQKSQQGGGSPMIRGFEASRVLLMMDYVRMNNLIYRSGHLQNLITMDQSSLSNVEITYGPSSVAYGSDALGGTIHLFTKEPVLYADNKLRHQSELSFQANSANRGANVHAETTLSRRKWGAYVSFSLQHSGDLRSGKNRNPFLKDDEYIQCEEYVKTVHGRDSVYRNENPHVQKRSDYTQYDGVAKFIYAPHTGIRHTFNMQFSTSGNVNRYDRLTDRSKGELKFAEWYYGPQTRWFGAYRMDLKPEVSLDRVSLQLSYQHVEESRHNRKLNNAYLGSRIEEVQVAALSLDAEKTIGKHLLRTGIEANLNFLNSSAHKTSVRNGEVKPLDTRYPDGRNYMHSAEAFLMHRCALGENGLHWFNGARIGGSFLYSEFKDKQFFPFPFDRIRQNNFTYSLSTSLVKMFDEGHSLALNVSSGFRVPNVDDAGKVFDSQPGTVIVPNQHLRPEQTLSGDLTYKTVLCDQLRLSASVYYTRLWDAIIVTPAAFAGKDSILYDGTMSQVLHNANARRGNIFGGSLNLTYDYARFRAEGSVSYTRGFAYSGEEKRTPLDHIAPLFGKIALKYRYLKKNPYNQIELFTLFNGKKDIGDYNLTGEDNIRYATVKGIDGRGLPAWFTLNVRASYQPGADWMLHLSVLNLLDTQYRTFASGINAPGRSVQLGARYRF